MRPVTVPDPELTLLERMEDVCDDEVDIEVVVALDDVDICLAFLQLPYELVLSEL